MALRFKQGDLAILMIARSTKSQPHVGKVGVIDRVGPMKPGDTFFWKGRWCVVDGAGDYVWTCGDDVSCGVVPMDWQLLKIDPPAEPESLRHMEDVEALA
jgi:hypothetical protein